MNKRFKIALTSKRWQLLMLFLQKINVCEVGNFIITFLCFSYKYRRQMVIRFLKLLACSNLLIGRNRNSELLVFILFGCQRAQNFFSLKLQNYFQQYCSLRQYSAINRWYLELKQGSLVKKIIDFTYCSPWKKILIPFTVYLHF